MNHDTIAAPQGQGLRATASGVALFLALSSACARSDSEPATPDMAMSVAPDLAPADPEDLLRSGCAVAMGQADRVPLYLLFVLDGSGSMRSNGKWAAAVPALTAIIEDLGATPDRSLGVGLTVFADQKDLTIGDTTAGPYDKMDVPVAYMDGPQLAKLKARITGTAPNLGTPTYEVLSGQYPLLRQFVPKAPLLAGGKRALVFITDGVPDPDMPAGQNEIPWSLALARQEAGRTDGTAIRTFSVGVGPFPPANLYAYSPPFLGALAIAGGTQASATCDPNEVQNPDNLCYFQVTPPTAGNPTAEEIQALTERFAATISSVRARATPCEYSLQAINGGQLDPASVNVVYQSSRGQRKVIGKSSTDGWTYDDPTRPTQVILHGATCEAVRADPGGVLTVVLGCATVIP